MKMALLRSVRVTGFCYNICLVLSVDNSLLFVTVVVGSLRY